MSLLVSKYIHRGISSVRRYSSNILIDSLGAHAYTDPSLYEKERRTLLGPSWQLFTHESRLIADSDKAPATYVAETFCGWPAIAVRSSKTGEIRAYHNICRHKAGPLEWDNSEGKCALHGLKCKYHGWTYSVDGELRGVPGFGEDGRTQLNKSDYNLWPMRVAVWRGLVFVQALPSPGVPMSGPEANDAFVRENAGFCKHLEEVPLEDFEFKIAKTHSLKCNWKVYVENYLEGYHIPTIHPGLSKEVDMQGYRVKVHDGFVEHIAPTLPEAGSAYKGLWVWNSPTLAVNWYGAGLSLERIVPMGVGSTEIRYMFLYHKESGAPQSEWQHALDTSKEVTEEDIGVCEAVQKGLDSGGYISPGKLSPRHEQGIAYFQQIIRDTHAK